MTTNPSLSQLKRIIYAIGLSVIGAFFFHVIFVAPFDKMRKSFHRKLKSNKIEMNCDANQSEVDSSANCEKQG